jgi:hypothetical protein
VRRNRAIVDDSPALWRLTSHQAECCSRAQKYTCHIGVDDAVVRELCFEKLAKIIDTSYDYVYDLWIYDNPITLGPATEFTVVEE